MSDAQRTERVQLLMTSAEVQAIDDWSFANRVRGRSEDIRRLIDLGLAHSRAGGETNAQPDATRASTRRRS